MMDNNEINLVGSSTDKFQCKACGGNMSFDPASGSLKCPYCGGVQVVENEKKIINEYDIDSITDDTESNQDWGSATKVIHCSSCGAQTVLNENSTAEFCAFCGSSHILKNDAKAGIVPESLIPFKITRESAIDSFKGNIRKKFFAPSKLKSNYQMQRINGVYIPHWTYDSDTYSDYTAEAGTYYYVTETVYVQENGKTVPKNQQVRKTSWRFVRGDYSRYFNDVLVNASKQVDKHLINNLGYDLEGLMPYKPEYLSGFLAEKYSVRLREGWNIARDEIDSALAIDIRREIHADEVRGLNINTRYSRIKFKHILLPVWISSYTYKKKVYNFMVNGQTGKVNASAPLSIFKVGAAVLLAVGMILLFLWLKNHNVPVTPQ